MYDLFAFTVQDQYTKQPTGPQSPTLPSTPFFYVAFTPFDPLTAVPFPST